MSLVLSRARRSGAALAFPLSFVLAASLAAQPAALSPTPTPARAERPTEVGGVEGRVTTPKGAPLADVMVMLRGAPGSMPRGAVTDADGRFVIPRVPAGDYTLVARRVGLAQAERAVAVSAAAARVELALAEEAAVVAPVVVTASREARRRDEASATIDVLDGAETRLARAAHPAQLLKRIPGVYVSQLSGEGHSMAMRQPISTKPTYLYLEDGVPTRATGFFNHNALYEVNLPQSGGVEVLKGPGTALYGSDAIGGVVNVLTRPAPPSPSAELSTEAGAFGYARALVTGGFTRGRDGVRADVNLTRMAGWRDGADYDRQSATVRWDHFTDGGLTVKTVVTGTLVDQLDLIAQNQAQYAARSPINRSPLAYRDVRAFRASAAFEKTSGGVSWSATPYARRNVLALIPNWQLTYDPQEYRTRSTSAGLLLKARRDFGARASGAPAARVLVGADLDYTPGDYRADSLRLFTSGTGGATVYDSARATRRLYDYDVPYRQASPYAQLELAPTARLHVDAGLRWDAASYDYETRLAPTQTGRWRVPESTSRSYARLSPKLGASYEASRAVALFGSWRTGFRAPSQGQLFVQGSAANTTDLRPVTVESAELGLRGQLGRRLLYQLSAYDMTVSDDILTYRTPQNTTEATNAGETRHRGVETSVSAMLRPTVRLDAAYSVTRQRYVTYTPQAARADAAGKLVAAEVSFAGRAIEQAPSSLGNVLLSWSPKALRGGRLAAEWSRTGRYVMGYKVNALGAPTDAVRYGGHQVWNLHANAQLSSRLELFGRLMNVTDRTYAETATYTANDRVQPDTYNPGNPRTIYAGVRVTAGR